MLVDSVHSRWDRCHRLANINVPLWTAKSPEIDVDEAKRGMRLVYAWRITTTVFVAIPTSRGGKDYVTLIFSTGSQLVFATNLCHFPAIFNSCSSTASLVTGVRSPITAANFDRAIAALPLVGSAGDTNVPVDGQK